MKVAPSIIAVDFSRFQKELKTVEKAGASLLHLDIMDGVFVPNITFGPLLVSAIRKITTTQLDVHLMIVKPERYLRQFIDAGADWISFHVEASKKIEYCIKYIRAQNKKAGLAISPATPFKKIRRYLPILDFLLIMSVNPGFYGQKFIPSTLKKITEAKNYITSHNYSCLLQVDGGINPQNAKMFAQVGADIIVAGAGIFKTRNYKKAIRDMQCLKP